MRRRSYSPPGETRTTPTITPDLDPAAIPVWCLACGQQLPADQIGVHDCPQGRT